jgi:hypothetical protein
MTRAASTVTSRTVRTPGTSTRHNGAVSAGSLPCARF